MNVFINLISKPGIIVIFGDKKIIDSISWESSMNEFDTLLEKLSELIERNNLKYNEISEIHTVNGPGGFTGTRTTALVVNTIKYLNPKIKLFSHDYFSIAELDNKNYPMLIKANKREYLVKKLKNQKPEIQKIDEIDNGIYFGIGDASDFDDKKIEINKELNIENIVKNISGAETEKIEPFYIKEPNITC